MKHSLDIHKIKVTLAHQADIQGWRSAARLMDSMSVDPDRVVWRIQGDSDGLFDAYESIPLETLGEQVPIYTQGRSVPSAFLSLTERALCHKASDRFDLCYRVLRRLLKQPKLLQIASDPDVMQLEAYRKSVARDMHKMKAFVRFREIEDGQSSTFVAWFEPDHYTLEATSSFFVKRFANQQWSILTPYRCAHWRDNALFFTPGTTKDMAPDSDHFEDLWRQYYASIFNPARVKIKAMTAEMPKKYWRNLPESSLIKPLIENAQTQVQAMAGMSERPALPYHAKRQASFSERRHDMDMFTPKPDTLKSLSQAMQACTQCPLYKDATQAVPGEGPENAGMMFVGEQPGDQEDLAGRPFVGPAGQMFDRALVDAGIRREDVFVTNAVRHFKFEARGRRRIHQKPNIEEINQCRHWLDQERAFIKPKLIVALGATAARSLLNKAVTVSKLRETTLELEDGALLIVTVHPSYLLRLPNEITQKDEYERFVRDLKRAERMLDRLAA
jgi:probable DNA metabolism protein